VLAGMMDPSRFFPTPPAQRQNRQIASRRYTVERLEGGCSLIWLRVNRTERAVALPLLGKDDGGPDMALSQPLGGAPAGLKN
jgi:hypothetical protein